MRERDETLCSARRASYGMHVVLRVLKCFGVTARVEKVIVLLAKLPCISDVYHKVISNLCCRIEC